MRLGEPMPSWYDIAGIDLRSNEKCKGIDESQARLAKILSREHKTTQLPYSRMMLVGFSQGGALSLFTGMQLPEKLAGIVMMSSYLPAASQFTITDGLHDTPILHCHGMGDPIVLYHMARKSQEIVVSEKGSTNYHLKAYPGLPHMVSPGELEDVQEFIEECLPDDPTYRITPKQPSEMSVKELKAAIRRAGLSKKAKGFEEKSEFIELLLNYREGKVSGSSKGKSKSKNKNKDKNKDKSKDKSKSKNKSKSKKKYEDGSQGLGVD